MSVFGDSISRIVLGFGMPSSQSNVALQLAGILLKRILSRLSWLGVRTIGNLHILTKASYFALLIVPILAGIWPYIRNLLNNYNETVKNSADLAIRTSNELDSKLEALVMHGESYILSTAVVQKEIELLSESLRRIGDNYTFLITNSNMPWSLAVAFFASLAVAIGHLTYQAFCPEDIKASDLEDYTEKKVTTYRASPSNIVLNESLELLEVKLATDKAEILQDVKTGDMSANELLTAIIDKVQFAAEFDDESHQYDVPDFEPVGSPENIAAELSIVEVAARVKYSDLISRNVELALFALLFYVIASVMICAVLSKQIVNILEAAGWV